MKAILLAGGKGTRLAPASLAVSKHLLPVYDKPLIYYSLSNILLAGIKEILLISTERDVPLYRGLLGDGRKYGLKIDYSIQHMPKGIPEALIIGEEFLEGDSVMLVLGDNIFHGTGITNLLIQSANLSDGAKIFLKRVPDPNRFGVATIDNNGRVETLEEKPLSAKSDFAVTGIYFFDQTAVYKSKSLTPSSRGEFEITDLLNQYLLTNSLEAEILPRGSLWLDTGTLDSLMDAAVFVKAVQSHTGQLIGSIEEIAFRNGWISGSDLSAIASGMPSEYGLALKAIADQV